VLIGYSTSSGSTAKDGKNGNSIYTKSLTENIKNYNLSINDIFSKTRETVIKQTNYSQIPWEYSSLLESKNFIFDNIP
uniref:caspase family protein n=1 Tax=Escherichia coli TaxID=562 RepID=UPI0013D4B2EB